MAADILFAAVAAAHLHHAEVLNTILRGEAAGKAAMLAGEDARYRTEMAVLGCSSVPPCVAPDATGSGRCAPKLLGDRRVVPSGAMIDLNGARWIAQSADEGAADVQALALGRDGALEVNAKPGEHAWFDPPRKIRAEFCGVRRFPKGVAAHTRFDLLVDRATNTSGLDWSSVVQIHQADMRYADGTYVAASPIFAIALRTDEEGDRLVVTGETAASPLRQPKLDPATGRQAIAADGPQWSAHFAPQRSLGRSAPLARGRWHRIDFRFIDGHGGPGSVTVAVDGQTVVDEPSLPTGYSYVDDLAGVPFAGGPQDTGSYVKFGIYAGLGEGSAPPRSGPIHLSFRNVTVAP